MTNQQMQELAITQVPISELRPDPGNPRRISDDELESLTRSIREFGLVDPIIARREDKTVIGGHQRLIAARRLGLKEVPVVFLDLSPEQARLLNLGLNRIGGTWDQELLARLLAELKEVPDVDLSLSGFSEDELKKFLKGLESREKRERLENFDLEAALEAARATPVAHTG
jgi:ParB-like chromosome segregation protein Spo0J